MEQADKKQIRDQLRTRSEVEGRIGHLLDKPLRVAAYQRVAESDTGQVTSYELFQAKYSALIKTHEEWSFVGTYIDEGKSLIAMNRLISDCADGRIDLIISGSALRFGCTLSQTIRISEKLKALNPPVGVFFESDGIWSLDDLAFQAMERIEGCDTCGSKT